MTARLDYQAAPRNITHATHAVSTIYIADDGEKTPVADVYLAADAAQRLVAAWNVCDDIDTQSLDLMGPGAMARELRRMRVLHRAVADAVIALDMMADRCMPGVSMEDGFNGVCEETGITAKVKAALFFEDGQDARGWRPSYSVQADAEGWGIFEDNEICRVDEADAFASDDDAIAFVRSCARRGSILHATALRICKLPLEVPKPPLVTPLEMAQKRGDFPALIDGEAVVVVEMEGGLINVVRASIPVSVIVLDADTEGGDASEIANVNGNAFYVSNHGVEASEVEVDSLAQIVRQVNEHHAAHA